MTLTATPDRLHMLFGLCTSWPFVISAAVYVAAVDGDATAAAEVVGAAKADVQAAFSRCIVFAT